MAVPVSSAYWCKHPSRRLAAVDSSSTIAILTTMFLLVCFLRIAFLIVCKNCHFVREHKSIFTFLSL